MALQHLRSSTANKRPLPAGMSDGQLAINTNLASPGLFFKDSNGDLVKVGPVHVGTTAPNSSPASGGQTGNTTGELWLDTSVSPNQLKTWNGSAWVSDFPDEIPVSKLADGAARQLLQTDAAGTGVEWTSNVDVPGTLDVTSTATFDSIASHPLGSESAPTITFTGDTNTGIYSPGADQLALSTNGTGRLTVDSTGNITHTYSDSSTSTSTQVPPGLRIYNTNNTLGRLAGIHFAHGGSGAATAGIFNVTTSTLSGSTDSLGDLAFYMKANGSGTMTERLRITSAGLVGVGTSTPVSGAQLTVAGSALAVTGQNLDHSANSIRIGQEGSGAAQIRCYGPNTSTNGSLTFKMSRSDGTNSQDVVIDGSGRLGIGTSSPSGTVHAYNAGGLTSVVIGGDAASSYSQVQLRNSSAKYNWSLSAQNNVDNGFEITPSTAAGGSTFSTPAVVVKSDGKVGIGTSTPGSYAQLAVFGTANVTTYGNVSAIFSDGTTGSARFHHSSGNVKLSSDNALAIGTGVSATEVARFDTSGRLLVGTSSSYGVGSSAQAKFQASDTTATIHASFTDWSSADSGGIIVLGKAKGGSAGDYTIVANGNTLGEIRFAGADGTDLETNGASIRAEVDGTPGANDMPGRLVFSTTADGASSPTERMRITNAGYLFVGKTSSDINVAGFQVYGQSGQTDVTVSGSECMNLNRNTSDGDIVRFRQDNNVEGSISVSGTTISYNGAHLSRWSQLPGGVERTEILRGTVLSNIDEMCEWGEEENEQLNRMKVSDVEGDKNVSGVFQSWDDDDDTYTNDFYCAMTGDFIIRIGAGVTVERGDLLMSAGDGTAKPQDDDIIRSKTIAKVTSTNVSCTYDDGSYCVPCVLMAC